MGAIKILKSYWLSHFLYLMNGINFMTFSLGADLGCCQNSTWSSHRGLHFTTVYFIVSVIKVAKSIIFSHAASACCTSELSCESHVTGDLRGDLWPLTWAMTSAHVGSCKLTYATPNKHMDPFRHTCLSFLNRRQIITLWKSQFFWASTRTWVAIMYSISTTLTIHAGHAWKYLSHVKQI